LAVFVIDKEDFHVLLTPTIYPLSFLKAYYDQ
jgi:hypothetical protein